MKRLDLRTKMANSFVEIPADFIDTYMTAAPELALKVYLYLVRASLNPSIILSVHDMAEAFDVTPNKIGQALMYWQDLKLLLLDIEDGEITEITILPLPPKKEKTFTTVVEQLPFTENKPTDYKEIFADPTFTEILELTEFYLGKAINTTLQSALADIYVLLDKKGELVEYLVEYCLDSKHTSPHYMKAVAEDWKEKGYSTIDEVKAAMSSFNQTHMSIMKAFGISNRQPAPVERAFIDTWTKDFPLELVIEACNRTIQNIQKPDFKYCDAIITTWKNAGATTFEEIVALDKQHEAIQKTLNPGVKPSAFHNYEQRKTNYDDLFKEL